MEAPIGHAGTLGTAIRNLVQKKLGFVDYSMHGLRKNVGTELALAGCAVPEIMAVLGHKSPKMAMFDVKQADKSGSTKRQPPSATAILSSAGEVVRLEQRAND